MNFIKKAAIAAVPALFLAFSGAALADHDGTPLSKDEKATVTLVHEFQDCVNGKLLQLTQQDVDAYVQQLLDEGVPPVQQIIQQLVEAKFIGDAQAACVAEQNIDVGTAGAAVDELIRKHGPSVLDRPAP